MNVRRRVLMALCVFIGVLTCWGAPALAASKGVVGFFGGTGTAGGLFHTPGGVAVNDTSGNVYVVDGANNRVQEFGAGGAFIRAWGLGVVSTGQDGGGTSTVEMVTVAGTSGTFTLSLAGQTTSAIAHDAPSSSVEAALDALPTIGGVGGSVKVAGEGTGINPYEVAFGGSLQGGEVAPMTVNTSGLGAPVGASLSCVAGPAGATAKTFQWLRNGVAIAGASSSTYTTTTEDEGDVVQCQVFAINANAGSTQVSAARAVVSPFPATAPPIAPASIAKPTIATGALEVGGPGGASLSCAPGSWTGASSFSYQWYRNGVALSGNGANTSAYTVQSADLMAAGVFQCAVTATDAGGSVTLVSANLPTKPEPSPAAPKATATATVPVLATVARTAVGAPAFEVCNATSSPQDVCKAGVAGPAADGSMSAPQGVAVEQVEGNVYVTDQGNRRVDEFTEAGAFVRTFGSSGAGAGEFGASIGYPAVDPTTGDVYVADPANTRVQVFESDGVFVHAFGWGVANGAGEFQVCTSTCQAGVVSASEIDLGRFATGSPTRVALDASGNAYVVDGGPPDYRVQKFASVSKENAPLAEFFAPAQLTGSSSATAPSVIAVEPTLGNVLAAREPSSPAEHLVYELGSGGALLGSYGEGAALPAPQGLAVGPSAASVYFSTATGNRVFVLGTTVAPTVTVEAATSPTASEATLHGTVDPNETAPNGIETTWQFEYSTNQTEWTPLAASKLAASTSPVAVTQTLTGLEGHTLYYARLHASKEFAAGSATSTTTQFTTAAAAPTVSGEAVTNVAATSATFGAQIDPQHLDTTYHFEYDTVPYTTSATHGTSLPVPDEDIGGGAGDVPVSRHPQDLRPDTVYHCRVVATNAVQTTDGPEHTFTTQPPGEALVLPDNRQWEMVSPPNKDGAQISPPGGLNESGGLVQTATDGSAITWTASTPIGAEPPGNISFAESQFFSARGVGGWSTRDITGPHEAPTGELVGNGTEYKFFSADLSFGLVEAPGKTPLSPQATEKTIYLRDTAASSYLPLVTAANVPEGTKIDKRSGTGKSFEEGQEERAAEEHGETPTFMGASPDLSHVVFGDRGEALTSNALAGSNLYEWAGGKLQLVNVLPDGEPTTGVVNLGSGEANASDVRRATVSNDGSRIIWSHVLNGEEGTSSLYIRDMVKGETVELDTVQPGAPGTGASTPAFQTADQTGSRVFFTDGQQLTEGSGDGDLYEFEVTSGTGEKLAGALTDLTVDRNAGENANVQDVLGASEDGAYVYLVATGVLSEVENAEHEKAVPGADNLYVLHDTGAGWTTTFIARLSSRPVAQASPDGRYMAFMSSRELTGYDNHDANSGAADEEVFLYHASTEHLVCVSCNPTGARPAGVFDSETGGLLIDQWRTWPERWLAGSLPAPDVVAKSLVIHQSRYLSDSGRLFFDSSDGLVPQDVNGVEDVYEFEPSGLRSCVSGAGTFDVVTGGCVSLISSGGSAEESVFMEAGEGGGDVFFLTAAKLVSQDYDTSMDVYDAHECTAEAPCVSSPVSSPPCTTADACRAPAAPQPPIFGAPPSQTFSGAGNLAPAPTAVVQAKPLTRAQKLAKALKTCTRKPKKQRAQCEKQARKQYGASKAKKTSTKKTSRGGK